MSLNFDTSKIEDKDFLTRMGSAEPGVMENPEKEYWSHEISSIVHWTMITNVGRITEANYLKWYERYVQYHLASGIPRDQWFVKLWMVRKAIGLSTNVSDYTDAAQAKWLRGIIERNAQDIAAAELRALDEPTADV
jgi:hypothetical protein